MNPLSEKELRVLNGITKIHDADVKLGDILANIIGASCENGTPVNANAAKAIFNIMGACSDGQAFTIGEDTYELLADAAQTKTVASNIPINIESNTVKASGVLTMDTQPTSGDTVSIMWNTYIFVPVGTANSPGEVSIGANLAEAQAALLAAINGTDNVNSPHPGAKAISWVTNVLTINALVGGEGGNGMRTIETFTAPTNIFAAATLGSGVDCSAADATSTIINAINGNTKTKVTASLLGEDTILLTANLKGIAGNEIALTGHGINGGFYNESDIVTFFLTGGVDGTVAPGMKFMADSEYMYFCPAGNTITGQNWRYVPLGLVGD